MYNVAEYLLDGFADIGVEVHGIDEIRIRILRRQIPYRLTNMDESFSKIFASMPRNKNQSFTIIKTSNIITGIL